MSKYVGVVKATNLTEYTDHTFSNSYIDNIDGKLYKLYTVKKHQIKRNQIINPTWYVDDTLTRFINIEQSKIENVSNSYVDIKGIPLVTYTGYDNLKFILLPKSSSNTSKNLLNTIINPFASGLEIYEKTDDTLRKESYINCIPFLFWYHSNFAHRILPRIEMQLDEMIFRRLFRYNNDLKVQHDTFKSTSSNIEYLFLYYDYIETNRLFGTEDALENMRNIKLNEYYKTTPYIHTQNKPQFYTHNWVASKIERGNNIYIQTTNWFYNIIDPSSPSKEINITNNEKKKHGERINSHIHIHNNSHSDANIMKINMENYDLSTYYSFCIITQIKDIPDKSDNILYTYVIIDTKKENTSVNLPSSLGIHGIKRAFKDLDVPYNNIINTLFPTIDTTKR